MTQYKTLKCPDCGKERNAPAYGTQTLKKRCDKCKNQKIQITKETAQTTASILNRAITFDTIINTFEEEEKALNELKNKLEK